MLLAPTLLTVTFCEPVAESKGTVNEKCPRSSVSVAARFPAATTSALPIGSRVTLLTTVPLMVPVWETSDGWAAAAPVSASEMHTISHHALHHEKHAFHHRKTTPHHRFQSVLALAVSVDVISVDEAKSLDFPTLPALGFGILIRPLGLSGVSGRPFRPCTTGQFRFVKVHRIQQVVGYICSVTRAKILSSVE